MNDAMLNDSIIYDSPKTKKRKRKTLDDQILDRLEKDWGLSQTKKDWRSKCPGHDGSNPTSLSITIGENGELLLYCHSNKCKKDEILAGLGLGGADTTEVGLAENWIEANKEHWKYVVSSSQCLHWRNWNGEQWQAISQVEVWNEFKNFINDLNLSDKAKKPMRKSTFITGAEKMARGEAVLDVGIFDSNSMLLNSPGGVLDLETGKLREQKPEDYLSMITRCTPDFEAKCPQWLKAINEWTQSDKELQKLLQVVAGLGLRGDNIEQKFILLHGKGQNGKSVFTDMLAYVMGDYCKTASPTVFKYKKFDGHPTELMALEGRRLVLVPELGTSFTLDEGLIKAFTGDGKISARAMRQDAREYKPVGLPVMTCNQLPRILDTGQSMKRRALVIPFKATIKKRDEQLLKKLQKEAPAILAWAIEGHNKYLESGLPSASCTDKEHESFFQEQDAIGRFMDECVENNSDSRVHCTQLYQSFKYWMKEQGEMYIPKQVGFTREINERWPQYERKKSGGSMYWQGVQLIQREEPI